MQDVAVGRATQALQRATVRFDSLDGLRTIGVLLVFAIHTGRPGLAAGRLGVGVFFPLSGFLITC